MNEWDVSPEQRAAEAGYHLAFKANEAFDALRGAVADQVALTRVLHLPGVDVSEEAIVANQEAIGERRFTFDALYEAAGTLIGPGSPGESCFGPGKTSETVASPTGILLTPEQEGKIYKVSEAMVSKFELDPAEVMFVMVETDDGQKPAVVHTGLEGLMMGSWNEIFAPYNADNFMIEVDGKAIDTRSGMTQATYRAFIADTRLKGFAYLPDSLPLIGDKSSRRSTFTLLTGEPKDDNSVQYAYVRNNKVVNAFCSAHCDDLGFRFRPVVVIE